MFSSTPSGSAFSTQPPFSFGNPSAPKNPTPLFNSFSANSMPSATTASTSDMAVDNGDDEDDAPELNLDPAAFSRKDKAKWKASGRTLVANPSPVGGEIAAWVSKQPPDEKLSNTQMSTSDRVVYIAAINKFPDAVQNLFAETFTLFVSLQRIVAASIRVPGLGSDRPSALAEVWDEKGNLVGLDGLLGPPNAETIIHMRRLVQMYLEELVKLRDADIDDETKIKYEAVYHIFNLAEILYLPQDGRGEGLLGEELLDWVNAVDTFHVNVQGNEVMQLKEPWEHPLFWPLVIRCLLRGLFIPASTFLRTLTNHPHPPIARLGQVLASNIANVPRSSNTDAYPLDHQFLAAYKRWIRQFRAEFETAIGGRSRGRWLDEGGSKSEYLSMEDEIRRVVELVQGNQERLLQEAGDWREAAGAWGVLVDVNLRRDDLPALMNRILDVIPADSTILEDSIQSSLCSGDIVRALMGCHELDIWLAAHLGDVFDKLALIPDDEEHFDTSLRDYFLLEYSDMLMDSPNQVDLWRAIAEYLAAAGSEGRVRLREYIVHVAVKLASGKPAGQIANGSMDVEVHSADGEEEQDDATTQLRELRQTCESLRLEEEWHTICAITSQRLMLRGDYGIAASLYLTAEDGFGLARVAEKILDKYVSSGAEEFLRLVDTLPPQILSDAPITLSELASGGHGLNGVETSETTMFMYAARLAFLSEFRDYLLYLGQGARDRAATMLVQILMRPITPVEFCGVLLAECVDLLEDEEILFDSESTFELMRVLEDVLAKSKFAPATYLGQLWRFLERKEGSANGSNGSNGSNGTSDANGHAKNAKDEEREGIQAALRKLEVVRLALARNLSRALVVGSEDAY